MKKRLIATLVSLITMIGALISTPAYAADAAYIEFGAFGCTDGYGSVEVSYINNDVSEQSLGLKLDGVTVAGYTLAPGARIDTVTVYKAWKPKLKFVSVLSTIRNGSAYGALIPLDMPRCDVSSSPKFKNTVLPKVIGTVAVGRTVSATTGKWSLAKLNFGYRWYIQNSDGYMVPIVGAYGRTYKIKRSDKGRELEVDVVAGLGTIVDQRVRSASHPVR